MPGVQHGAAVITAIQHGAASITSMQHGAAVVWSPGGFILDDFNRIDGDLPGPDWVDLLPGSFHKLRIQDGRLRCGIPDGLIGLFWDFTTSAYRYTAAVNPTDDGYVEVRAGTRGDAASFTSFNGYVTDVYHRSNNTGGSYTSGVGLRLRGGQCSIMTKIAGVEYERTSGGTFQSGDRIRVRSSVNLHTISVNGQDRGVWNDSGATVPKGAGYRSLVVMSQGAKDFLGPRRFGPALDYVMMG